jgi:hypothetical protein
MSTVTDPKFNPSGNEAVTRIKEAGVALEEEIKRGAASSRRQAVALTQLETAIMWAVAAVTRGDS